MFVAMSHWSNGYCLVRTGALPSGLAHLEQVVAFYDPQQHRDTVILVDMLVDERVEAGTRRTFDLASEGLPYGLACSSHSMDLAQCIELARTLERLPGNIEVVGVVGAQVAPGSGLSQPVQDAMEAVCRDIVARLPIEADDHA